MSAVPFLGFAAIALVAAGFATFVLWRARPRGWPLLAGAILIFLLGVGGGTYFMVGQPLLALRAAKGLNVEGQDIKGLIPYLVARVRKEPGDLQAWIYLARAYLTADDAVDAAKAYGRAVTVARLIHQESSDLDSVYGETLMAVDNGAISDESEAAFAHALSLNPKDPAARFFLGQARAQKGDAPGAIALWQSLLADVPANAPLHQTLVDRIALLTAQAQGAAPGAGPMMGAPDPKVMVAGLAARLKDNPNDIDGWRRLIRAYTVLGQPADAKTALATARKTFAGNKDALAALNTDATDLKLN